MGFDEYITPEGREGLKRYRYKGTDHSLIYHYVNSPWAQYLVENFVPTRVAPNTITLTGLIFQFFALIVGFSLAPDFGSMDPFWGSVSAFIAGLCLIIYSTLDNMDGKHARRTGSGSPLGLLFDHGCDAINAGLVGWATYAIHTSVGASGWRIFAFWLVPVVPFFFNTWEEFHIGELILPIINGPNEGLLMTELTLFATAILGTSFWMEPFTLSSTLAWLITPIVDLIYSIAGEPLIYSKKLNFASVSSLFSYIKYWFNNTPPAKPFLNIDVLIVITFIFASFTIIYQLINVIKFELKKEGGGISHVFAALRRLLPICALVLIAFLWRNEPSGRAVVNFHWLAFFSTAGCIFVDITCKLMVSHCCDMEYKPALAPFVVFSVYPFLKVVGFSASGVADTELASYCLGFSLFFCFAHVVVFLLKSIDSITSALDICVFNIDKQLERSKKADENVLDASAASTSTSSGVSTATAAVVKRASVKNKRQVDVESNIDESSDEAESSVEENEVLISQKGNDLAKQLKNRQRASSATPSRSPAKPKTTPSKLSKKDTPSKSASKSKKSSETPTRQRSASKARK